MSLGWFLNRCIAEDWGFLAYMDIEFENKEKGYKV